MIKESFNKEKDPVPNFMKDNLATITFELSRTKVHHVRTVMTLIDFLGTLGGLSGLLLGFLSLVIQPISTFTFYM